MGVPASVFMKIWVVCAIPCFWTFWVPALVFRAFRWSQKDGFEGSRGVLASVFRLFFFFAISCFLKRLGPCLVV